VQQLRDGVNNFFAVFVEVRKERATAGFEVEGIFTSGDYLQGFLRGTRKALAENGRESVTLSIAELNAFSLGMLIALFERAVGFYATLVNVNAYHQPGVEAGKKAAEAFLQTLAGVANALPSSGPGATAEDIATKLGADIEEVFHILHHLADNGRVSLVELGDLPANDRFLKV